MSGITTGTVPIGPWSYKRRNHSLIQIQPAPSRTGRLWCADVICSVVSCTSTGELHERLNAPFKLFDVAIRQRKAQVPAHASTMTSGGKQNPAKAERVTDAG